MAKYLVTIHRPNGWDGETQVDATMMRDIDELNDAMVAVGVRVFVGGLRPVQDAWSLNRDASGNVSASQSLFLKADEFVNGLWVLEVVDLEEALDWGRRAAIACRGSVEVRPFH